MQKDDTHEIWESSELTTQNFRENLIPGSDEEGPFLPSKLLGQPILLFSWRYLGTILVLKFPYKKHWLHPLGRNNFICTNSPIGITPRTGFVNLDIFRNVIERISDHTTGGSYQFYVQSWNKSWGVNESTIVLIELESCRSFRKFDYDAFQYDLNQIDIYDMNIVLSLWVKTHC